MSSIHYLMNGRHFSAQAITACIYLSLRKVSTVKTPLITSVACKNKKFTIRLEVDFFSGQLKLAHQHRIC